MNISKWSVSGDHSRQVNVLFIYLDEKDLLFWIDNCFKDKKTDSMDSESESHRLKKTSWGILKSS